MAEIVVERVTKAFPGCVAVDDVSLRSRTASFNAPVDARTEARPGRPLRLAVDPSAFDFFDASTGEAVPHAASLEAMAETA